MVSVMSFRLIRLIAHGYEGQELLLRETQEETQLHDVCEFPVEPPVEPPVETHPCYREPAYNQLVESYTPDITFEFPLTNQMMAAFGTFWKHRSPLFSVGVAYRDQDLDAVKYDDVDVDILGPDGSPSGEKWHWERPRALTPLEVCAHFLFYEPSPSDFLNRQILIVLDWYRQECNRTRQDPSVNADDPKSYAKYQREVLELDIAFFECIRTKAIRRDEKLIDLTALLTALPIHPLDQLVVDRVHEQIRAPLNGAVVEFALLLVEAEFFTDQFGPTELSRVVMDHANREAEDCELIRSMSPGGAVIDEVAKALRSRHPLFDYERQRVPDRPPTEPRRGPLVDLAEPLEDVPGSALCESVRAPRISERC
jgi:hypothetical protein